MTCYPAPRLSYRPEFNCPPEIPLRSRIRSIFLDFDDFAFGLLDLNFKFRLLKLCFYCTLLVYIDYCLVIIVPPIFIDRDMR